MLKHISSEILPIHLYVNSTLKRQLCFLGFYLVKKEKPRTSTSLSDRGFMLISLLLINSPTTYVKEQISLR
jgi:hypothetical protein